MSILLFGVIIACFLLVIISSIALVVKSPKERVRHWLAVFLVFGAIWSLVINLQTPENSSEYNLWIVRSTFVAAILMMYSMIHFVAAVIDRKLPQFVGVLITTGTAMLIVSNLAGWIIPSVAIVGDFVVPKRLFAYYVVVGFILALAVYSIGLLCSALKRSENEIMHNRLRIVLMGLTIGIIVGIFTNILLPNVLGSIAPARFGWLAIAIWAITLVYAVVRHQFLDIRLAAVRTVAYFMVLATMIAIYFSSAFLVSQFLRGFLTAGIETVINLLIALVLALVFQPIRYFFDRLTNRVFYRDDYSIDDFFARISRKLSSTTDLRTLLENAAAEIGDTLRAEQSLFVVYYGHKHKMTVGKDEAMRPTISNITDLQAVSKKLNGEVLVARSLSLHDPIRIFLNTKKIAIVVPLMWRSNTLCYLFLGERRSGEYGQKDIRALETVSDEVSIAIQNALSVQEVKEINATLQQRIEEATKELRASNTQLQQLDEAKDEFVSMASHQLRTPLTSVKGYISMVLEGDAGKITATQRKLLGEAFTSSERMVHLISDFLNVSRLQTGKFMLERRPINLAKIVTQEVDSLQTTARAHNLTLQYRPPSYFPTLTLDEAKIRQVLMNFIDNAIYYSEEGTSITVSLSVEEGSVVLRVHDTGIGVPQTEQAHLFTKFFRATNARKQRPDGTGVGLFLAKKVIDAHGGDILFESTEGKGSTFGFRLPVKKLSANNKADKLDQ